MDREDQRQKGLQDRRSSHGEKPCYPNRVMMARTISAGEKPMESGDALLGRLWRVFVT